MYHCSSVCTVYFTLSYQCKTWGSQSDEYSNCGLLGCDMVGHQHFRGPCCLHFHPEDEGNMVLPHCYMVS